MKEFFKSHPIATFFCVDAIVTGVVKVVEILRGPKTVYIEKNDDNAAELDDPEETIEEEES